MNCGEGWHEPSLPEDFDLPSRYSANQARAFTPDLSARRNGAGERETRLPSPPAPDGSLPRSVLLRDLVAPGFPALGEQTVSGRVCAEQDNVGWKRDREGRSRTKRDREGS